MSGQERKTPSLSMDIKKKTVGGGRTVLRNISAEFSAGDFVLILGGSGTGKTMLLRTLTACTGTVGSVTLNGRDLYSDFASMRSMIAVVPQFLNLRPNDTVRGTLADTAAVRLGRSCSRSERQRRVEEILRRIGMTEHADKYIGQLSGGQQKKVAVADQLIGPSQVLICDEPDSGLDAASRIQQMEMLGSIARRGKIVMVISHEPDDAAVIKGDTRRTLFDKVVVLAKSSRDSAGHLAFAGRTEDALRFFGVSRLEDIMLELNPLAEGGRGRSDEFIDKFAALRGGN